jgi:hypothetical protein
MTSRAPEEGVEFPIRIILSACISAISFNVGIDIPSTGSGTSNSHSCRHGGAAHSREHFLQIV